MEQANTPDLLTAMPAKEIDQAMRGRDIGTHRVRRAATIMSEMACPTCGQGSRGMVVIV